jgi:cell division protein FtsW
MPLLINGIILIIFGLLAVYSTSIYEAFTKTGDNFFYFTKQISAIIYIIVAGIIVRKFPMKILKSHKFATFVLVVAFILQLLVFSPLGAEYHGARGRLDIPGLPNIQPSEVFKLAYVLFLSSWLLRKKELMQTPQFLLNFIAISALLYAIFLFIPDFGTVLIIGATALIMVRYAGLSLKKTLSILAIGLFAGVFAGFSLAVINPKLTYIKDRFSYFFETNKDAKDAQKEKT